MKTRQAVMKDLEWLLEECIAFSKEYKSKHNLTGNLPYAVTFLQNMIEKHLVLICEDSGVATGFIAGFVQPHHFNPDVIMLSEVLWWVKKEHRGGQSGSVLLDAFIKFGKEHFQWITFSMAKNTPISDEPLLKRGFELTERAYLLECDPPRKG